MREYLDRVYRYLMERYHYSPNEIDRMDFFRTSDLVFSEMKDNQQEGLVYADDFNW